MGGSKYLDKNEPTAHATASVQELYKINSKGKRPKFHLIAVTTIYQTKT